MYLKSKNLHIRDNNIRFDEKPHLYYVNNIIYKTSVTKIIHSFFPSFDADKVISNMMKSKNWEKSPYYGKTANEIKEQWKNKGLTSSKQGTNLHKTIELYYNNEKIEDDSIEFKYFLNFNETFVEKNKWIPYRTEWEVYDEKYKIAGSIDMLYECNGKYYIVDWKRCVNIKDTNYFESALPPIEHLPNSNKWQYSLQLNTYKYILEKNYGIEIDGMCLIILHPENENYIKIDILDMKNEIENVLEAYKLKESF